MIKGLENCKKDYMEPIKNDKSIVIEGDILWYSWLYSKIAIPIRIYYEYKYSYQYWSHRKIYGRVKSFGFV